MHPPGSQILKPTKLSTKFVKFLHDHDLVDVWRECNATKHDYTFYSHVHFTYSRIDHIFTSASFLPICTASKILETPWSDHSLVVARLPSLHSPSASYTWGINESHLSNPVTCLDIKLALKEYFSLNNPDQSSPMCNWAHKATVRGILIQI